MTPDLYFGAAADAVLNKPTLRIVPAAPVSIDQKRADARERAAAWQADKELAERLDVARELAFGQASKA